MAEIHVHYPDGHERTFPLAQSDIIIGRDPTCEITLDDALTSRRHARIYRDQEDRLWAEDLHSKNGTTLNDQTITAVRINEGDRIGIGGCYLVLHKITPPKIVMDSDTTQFGAQSVWRMNQRLNLPKTRLEKLYELNDRLQGRFDRDDLLNEVVDVCIETLGLERVGLALWSGDAAPPQWIVLRNLRREGGSEFRISRSLVDRALHQGERILIRDAVHEMVNPTDSIISNHICSAMVVPLVYDNRVRGVLYGDRVTSSGGYTQEDIDFFAALGRQAAMGLAHVQLLEEVQRRRQIEAQLQLARQIQNRLFPREPLSHGGLTIEALNDPGWQVSGDYFDYFARPDGLIVAVMADVSGKGVAAALLMANLQAAVHVTLKEERDLVRATRRLNDLICQNVDSEKFITGIIGLVDPAARTFAFVNLGHPAPFHVTADGSVTRPPVVASLPLGVEPDVEHEVVVYPLGRNASTLFLFTDGVPDAENDKDEHYGEDRVAEQLKTAAGEPPREVIQRVRRSIQQYARHARQNDDITMMAIQLK